MSRNDRYTAAIRAAITAAGPETTQTSVAMAAGIPAGTWHRRMRTLKSQWRASELEAIAHALGMTLDQLIGSGQ